MSREIFQGYTQQQLDQIREAQEHILSAEEALLNVAGLRHCVDMLHSIYYKLKAEATNEQITD